MSPLLAFEKDFIQEVHQLTSWSKRTAEAMAQKWDLLNEEQRSRVVWDTQLWSRPKVMEGLAGIGVDLTRWHCPPPTAGTKDVQHLLRGSEFKTAGPLEGEAVRKLAFWMNVSPVTQAALTRTEVPTGSEQFSSWVKSATDNTWLNSFRYACEVEPEQLEAWAQAETPILAISAVFAYLEKNTQASKALATEVVVLGSADERLRRDVAQYYAKQPDKLDRLEKLLAEARVLRLDRSLPEATPSRRGPRF